MPTPTEKNTERIEKLGEVVNELIRRVDKVEGDANWASEWVEKLRAADEQLRVNQVRQDQAIEEVRKSHERWGGRAWQLASGLGLLLVGAILGYLLKR